MGGVRAATVPAEPLTARCKKRTLYPSLASANPHFRPTHRRSDGSLSLPPVAGGPSPLPRRSSARRQGRRAPSSIDRFLNPLENRPKMHLEPTEIQRMPPNPDFHTPKLQEPVVRFFVGLKRTPETVP